MLCCFQFNTQDFPSFRKTFICYGLFLDWQNIQGNSANKKKQIDTNREKNNNSERNWKKDSLTSLLIRKHVWHCAWLLISSYPVTQCYRECKAAPTAWWPPPVSSLNSYNEVKLDSITIYCIRCLLGSRGKHTALECTDCAAKLVWQSIG